MVKRVLLRLFVALASATALVGVAPVAASAEPTNDDFAGATTISSLPFETNQDVSSATADSSDPRGCANPYQSVWFSYTPSTDMFIRANTVWGSYSTVLSAWTGTQGALTMVACNTSYDSPDGDIDSQITFAATAGTTYYFMVTAWFDDEEVLDLSLSVDQVTPPANDKFTDATVIGSIPLSHGQDLGAAGVEPGEPSDCISTQKTVWYSYTPTITQSITAEASWWGTVAVFSGTSLADLTPIGCSGRRTPVTFRAQAGTTYLFQVVQRWCCDRSAETGTVEFDLDVAPDPQAEPYFSPADPSTYDTIQFKDYSFDPGRNQFASRLWEFGDGTTSTEHDPTHRYTADGDYPLRLTVTTTDGRTASRTKVVSVRTHDVAVTSVTAPETRAVGHSLKVSVRVHNSLLPESVRVDLRRNAAGGSAQVGSLTQDVPVLQGDHTTVFVFTYTVTDADQAAGQIAFQATATVIGGRDAVPADNTAVSTPVTVG